MKKILALVLALVMVLGAVSAMATDSPDPSKKQGGGSGTPASTDTGSSSSTTTTTTTTTTTNNKATTPYWSTEEGLKLVLLAKNSDAIQKIIDQFKAAYDSGNVMGAFPESIKVLLKEYSSVNEMVSAKFVGNTDKVTGNMSFNIQFVTVYDKSVNPKLAVVIVDVDNGTWSKFDGSVRTNGTVDVTIDKTTIQTLENREFLIVVASK